MPRCHPARSARQLRSLELLVHTHLRGDLPLHARISPACPSIAHIPSHIVVSYHFKRIAARHQILCQVLQVRHRTPLFVRRMDEFRMQRAEQHLRRPSHRATQLASGLTIAATPVKLTQHMLAASSHSPQFGQPWVVSPPPSDRYLRVAQGRGTASGSSDAGHMARAICERSESECQGNGTPEPPRRAAGAWHRAHGRIGSGGAPPPLELAEREHKVAALACAQLAGIVWHRRVLRPLLQVVIHLLDGALDTNHCFFFSPRLGQTGNGCTCAGR